MINITRPHLQVIYMGCIVLFLTTLFNYSIIQVTLHALCITQRKPANISFNGGNINTALIKDRINDGKTEKR